jgi:arylsulfatase A-like enzyme
MSTRKATVLSYVALGLGACAWSADDASPLEQQTDPLSHADDDDHALGSRIRHVVLISIDGLHQTDVDHFVAAHPESTLAALLERGVKYTDAHASTPSDSFPGLLALVTGGTPRSTGVYYDDSYDRMLYAPGSNCQGPLGTQVVYDESLDLDASRVFSGGINPANLPLVKDAHGNCRPVFPHDFLRVNTIFEVIHRAGGRTAWSDKHPAYDIVNGPSGTGVDDLYTPEINSLIVNGGTVNGVDLAGSLARCDGVTNSLSLAKVDDFTTCEPAVMAYDDTKVQAVINEINGKTSDGARRARVPAILGMNFQGVSVGQKLPVGGYTNGAGTPSSLLAASIAHVDASLGRMVEALEANHLRHSTLFVISAKHGQSPIDRTKLAMEPGGSGSATVTDPIGFINAADPNVDAVFGSYVNPNSGSPYAIGGHFKTDDVGVLWLQDQSPANIAGVVARLTAPGNRVSMFANVLPPDTIFPSSITSGRALAAIYGDPTSGDQLAAARAPNVFVQPNAGVIYSASKKKIAEHGGGTVDDTHVALIVSGPGLHPRTIPQRVSTTQVAPTILRSLALDPEALASVRSQGTQVLPGLALETREP